MQKDQILKAYSKRGLAKEIFRPQMALDIVNSKDDKLYKIPLSDHVILHLI